MRGLYLVACSVVSAVAWASTDEDLLDDDYDDNDDDRHDDNVTMDLSSHSWWNTHYSDRFSGEGQHESSWAGDAWFGRHHDAVLSIVASHFLPRPRQAHPLSDSCCEIPFDAYSSSGSMDTARVEEAIDDCLSTPRAKEHIERSALVLGVGTSLLAEKIAALSTFDAVHAIDGAAMAVRAARLRQAERVTSSALSDGARCLSRHALVRYAEMDARGLAFRNASFALVVDEGVLDGMSPSCLPPPARPKAERDVSAALAEALRVLPTHTAPAVLLLVGLGLPTGAAGVQALLRWLAAHPAASASEQQLCTGHSAIDDSGSACMRQDLGSHELCACSSWCGSADEPESSLFSIAATRTNAGN